MSISWELSRALQRLPDSIERVAEAIQSANRPRDPIVIVVPANTSPDQLVRGGAEGGTQGMKTPPPVIQLRPWEEQRVESSGGYRSRI